MSRDGVKIFFARELRTPFPRYCIREISSARRLPPPPPPHTTVRMYKYRRRGMTISILRAYADAVRDEYAFAEFRNIASRARYRRVRL